MNPDNSSTANKVRWTIIDCGARHASPEIYLNLNLSPEHVVEEFQQKWCLLAHVFIQLRPFTILLLLLKLSLKHLYANRFQC